MAHLREQQKIDEYLKDLRRGDSAALSALYDATSKQLYSLCYTYMHSHQDSEDALSDTYLAVVRGIDKFKGKNGFNWMYTIAKNVCLDLIRKKKRAVMVDFDDEETVNTLRLSSDTPQAHDESGIIALSEKVLNENEFRIVVLHAINGLKFKEIAETVGGKESTVRWQYNNALQKVKEVYQRRESYGG
ncbi:MAG: RNA polymerase sigma factor [Clostridia bacterium]|nr:RNA polymerase sigma factor [Clostridia bacterium]